MADCTHGDGPLVARLHRRNRTQPNATERNQTQQGLVSFATIFQLKVSRSHGAGIWLRVGALSHQIYGASSPTIGNAMVNDHTLGRGTGSAIRLEPVGCVGFVNLLVSYMLKPVIYTLIFALIFVYICSIFTRLSDCESL